MSKNNLSDQALKLSWFPNSFDSDKLVKLLSKEKERNIENTLWKCRPTRLFNLPFDNIELYQEERERFSFALKANVYEYSKIVALFKDDEEILDKLEFINAQTLQGISFPAVFKKTNRKPFLPYCSFSGFINSINSEKAFTVTSKKISEILAKHLGYEIDSIFLPEISLFHDTLEGQSYELALLLHQMFYYCKNEFILPLTICCTGKVNKNGEIEKIDCADKKYEAMKSKKYDFIIFPEANRTELNDTNENVLFFDNIYDLHSWFLSQTDRNKRTIEIQNWAYSNIECNIPKDNFFMDYFFTKKACSISSWRNLLDYESNDDKINKLKTIADKALQICFNSEFKLQIIYSLLPKDKFYYIIPYLFENIHKQNEKYSGKNLDEIYLKTSKLLELPCLDTTHASKQLIEDNAYKFIAVSENLRKRYPKLLYIFLNTPDDLLLMLSYMSNLTSKEKLLLCEIDSQIQQNKQDQEIMTNSLKIYGNGFPKLFSSPERLEKQLKNIFIAKENFKAKKQNYAAKICIDYFKHKISAFTANEQKIILKKFLKPETKLNDQNKKVLFKRSLNSFAKITKNLFTIEYEFKYEDNAKKIYEYLNNFVNQKSDTEITLNPVINLYKNIRNYQTPYKLKNIIENLVFSNSEADNLKLECLIFWLGKYLWNSKFNLLDIPKNNFKIPLLCGVILNNNCNKEYIKQAKKILIKLLIKKHDPRQLLWLHFLDSDLQRHAIQKILNDYCVEKAKTYSNNNEKHNFTVKFLYALFSLDKKIENDFHNLSTHWLNSSDSWKTRRTGQLLIPLFLTIKEGFDTINLSDKAYGLNNSQFATEFIKNFCIEENPNSLFRPINWKQSIDKQMFTTLSIVALTKKSDLLKHYIANCVDDLPNLYFAIAML